jgi:hypothetical protein
LRRGTLAIWCGPSCHLHALQLATRLNTKGFGHGAPQRHAQSPDEPWSQCHRDGDRQRSKRHQWRGELYLRCGRNRKQITSTLAPVPAGLWNYNANDRFTAGDTYDADGNTVSSGGIANVYDFENHLIQKAGVTIVYDGDGNRVSKTVAGVTTTYLVDTLNPTGYAQVVYESFNGSSSGNYELNHSYVYGLELISQTRSYVANFQSATQKIYYAYDGHGSVRGLTSPTGGDSGRPKSCRLRVPSGKLAPDYRCELQFRTTRPVTIGRSLTRG